MSSLRSRSAVMLLLLLSTACAHTRSRSSGSPVAIGLAVREGYVQVEDSVRLFYRMVGEGEDTVVVLHGGPGFHFNYLAPDLLPLAAHRALLFFDQRNAGRSTILADTAQANARHLVSDLEALRRHFGMERLTLLAHSWGGLLAGLYAVQYPAHVERMLLIGAMPPSAEPMRLFDPMARLDSIANLDRIRNLNAYRAGQPDSTKACWDYYALWARGYFTSPVQARRMWGDLCNVLPAAMLNPTRSYPVQSLGAWDVTAALGQVSAPVLVIHGEQDPMPLSSAKSWVSALPNARLLVVPNSAHLPHVDQPSAFFTAAGTFLAGDWPDPAVPPVHTTAVVLSGDDQRSDYLTARASVARIENELVRAVARADWDGVAALYAEGAFLFAPGAPPVIGRQAIASFWRTAAKRGMRTLELQLMDLEGSGDQLHALGKYVVRDATDEILDVGKFLAVYRRIGGEWRLYGDVLNSSMETRSPLEIPDYLTAPGR